MFRDWQYQSKFIYAAELVRIFLQHQAKLSSKHAGNLSTLSSQLIFDPEVLNTCICRPTYTGGFYILVDTMNIVHVPSGQQVSDLDLAIEFKSLASTGQVLLASYGSGSGHLHMKLLWYSLFRTL